MRVFFVQHLQFFVEVVESSEDLSMSSRWRDEDGLQEENEERRRKKKWSAAAVARKSSKRR